MATNAVAWLREYLTARDLDTEVASGLAVEPSGQAQLMREQLAHEHLAHEHLVQAQVTREHLSGTQLVLERLPEPLPPSVRSVAMILLIVFGVLCGAGALFVVGGGLAVVLMPIVMGREGVGTAMITLFAVCLTFVCSGILMLAARSAARVIRRERRGVRSLYAFSLTGAIVAILATVVTQWLSIAFFATSDGDRATFAWSVVARVIEVSFILLFSWAIFVLRPYARRVGIGN